MLTLVIFIILIALVFDFINGFHDAANSIATVVSTRVLTPRFAVMWAAFFNFIAAFGFGTHVATTMGRGMIQLDVVNEYVILAGLIGAILWDLITWYFALPTSSSHALMGGYAGAAIARAGFSAIVAGGWIKTLTFIVLSPIIGGILGFTPDGGCVPGFPKLPALIGGQVLWQTATGISWILQSWARHQ